MSGDVERKLDTLQAIELAEGVEVRLRIAGPILRGGALLLDVLIQWLLIGALTLLFALTVGWVAGGQMSWGVVQLLWFFFSWWYPVFFEAGKWGATPGKKVFGLRVVQVSGSPITFGQAILRNFLRVADGMPFMIGYGVAGLIPTFGIGLATMLATSRFQRLGDLAARTVVIYDRVPAEPLAPSPPALESIPPGVALRPEEIRAVGAFRDRAGLWSEGRRIEIGDHARELTGSAGSAGVTRLMGIARWLQERK
ncbi:MAG: RDD family protein [Akkermansiaceae bacterium]|jgi:uncharacterized RDD family membrane protein YckC|nr:RDD family protein [Akkermansiaceae bacterium]